ncbi:hypothetical protein PR048_015656 [Dryococelus australis]|uniref:Tc1-like transposase DDE domain-containing protein n=1 Tax=Dryococelus australis TaxID=614101 RepID=A0ABQ9HHJ1_9NEOP|nr:hypothetical protein PR048_015656 [Dryococelus australis]
MMFQPTDYAGPSPGVSSGPIETPRGPGPLSIAPYPPTPHQLATPPPPLLTGQPTCGKTLRAALRSVQVTVSGNEPMLRVTALGDSVTARVLYTLDARSRNQLPEWSVEKLNVLRPLTRERRGTQYTRAVTSYALNATELRRVQLVSWWSGLVIHPGHKQSRVRAEQPNRKLGLCLLLDVFGSRCLKKASVLSLGLRGEYAVSQQHAAEPKSHQNSFYTKAWVAISRPSGGCEEVHRLTIAIVSVWAMLGPFVFNTPGPVMGRVWLVSGATSGPAVVSGAYQLLANCLPAWHPTVNHKLAIYVLLEETPVEPLPSDDRCRLKPRPSAVISTTLLVHPRLNRSPRFPLVLPDSLGGNIDVIADGIAETPLRQVGPIILLTSVDLSIFRRCDTAPVACDYCLNNNCWPHSSHAWPRLRRDILEVDLQQGFRKVGSNLEWTIQVEWATMTQKPVDHFMLSVNRQCTFFSNQPGQMTITDNHNDQQLKLAYEMAIKTAILAGQPTPTKPTIQHDRRTRPTLPTSQQDLPYQTTKKADRSYQITIPTDLLYQQTIHTGLACCDNTIGPYRPLTSILFMPTDRQDQQSIPTIKTKLEQLKTLIDVAAFQSDADLNITTQININPTDKTNQQDQLDQKANYSIRLTHQTNQLDCPTNPADQQTKHANNSNWLCHQTILQFSPHELRLLIDNIHHHRREQSFPSSQPQLRFFDEEATFYDVEKHITYIQISFEKIATPNQKNRRFCEPGLKNPASRSNGLPTSGCYALHGPSKYQQRFTGILDMLCETNIRGSLLLQAIHSKASISSFARRDFRWQEVRISQHHVATSPMKVIARFILLDMDTSEMNSSTILLVVSLKNCRNIYALWQTVLFLFAHALWYHVKVLRRCGLMQQYGVHNWKSPFVIFLVAEAMVVRSLLPGTSCIRTAPIAVCEASQAKIVHRCSSNFAIIALWGTYGMDLRFFQDDNARCHVSRATMQLYAENNVRRLDWPAQSPDLNSIEHLWNELNRRMRARQARPKSIAQLMDWLQEEWRRIPVDVLQTLVESMLDRMAAIIAAIRDSDIIKRLISKLLFGLTKFNSIHRPHEVEATHSVFVSRLIARYSVFLSSVFRLLTAWPVHSGTAGGLEWRGVHCAPSSDAYEGRGEGRGVAALFCTLGEGTILSKQLAPGTSEGLISDVIYAWCQLCHQEPSCRASTRLLYPILIPPAKLLPFSPHGSGKRQSRVSRLWKQMLLFPRLREGLKSWAMELFQRGWSSVGMKVWGKRDIPRKPPTSVIVRHNSGMRRSGVTRLGIEPGSPWWEASRLTAQPRWPQNMLLTGHGIVVVRLITSHHGEPSSVPGVFEPRFSHVRIMSDDAAGQRVFSWISRFSRLCIPALPHTHLASPSSCLKTSMLSAAPNSPPHYTTPLPLVYWLPHEEGWCLATHFFAIEGLVDPFRIVRQPVSAKLTKRVNAVYANYVKRVPVKKPRISFPVTQCSKVSLDGAAGRPFIFPMDRSSVTVEKRVIRSYGAGMLGRRKREIPEKTRRHYFHMRRSGGGGPLGIEPCSPRWVASSLTTTPPRRDSVLEKRSFRDGVCPGAHDYTVWAGNAAGSPLLSSAKASTPNCALACGAMNSNSLPNHGVFHLRIKHHAGTPSERCMTNRHAHVAGWPDNLISTLRNTDMNLHEWIRVERFGRLLTARFLKYDEDEASDRLQGRAKLNIPMENPLTKASSDTIPTCENPVVTPPGIEPGAPNGSEDRAIPSGITVSQWIERFQRRASGRAVWEFYEFEGFRGIKRQVCEDNEATRQQSLELQRVTSGSEVFGLRASV